MYYCGLIICLSGQLRHCSNFECRDARSPPTCLLQRGRSKAAWRSEVPTLLIFNKSVHFQHVLTSSFVFCFRLHFRLPLWLPLELDCAMQASRELCSAAHRTPMRQSKCFTAGIKCSWRMIQLSEKSRCVAHELPSYWFASTTPRCGAALEILVLEQEATFGGTHNPTTSLWSFLIRLSVSAAGISHVITSPHVRYLQVVCTIGPACWDVPTLVQMIDK